LGGVNYEQTLEGEVDDFSLQPVPIEKRRSWLEIALVWIGVSYGATAVLFAVTLISGLSYWEAVLACVLGNAIMFFLMVMMGSIGAREGTATGLIVRALCGKYGSYVFAILLAFSLIGWYAYQTQYFGIGISQLVPAFGEHIRLVTFVFGLIMMTTAIIGYKGLQSLSNIAVPLFLIWMFAGVIKAFMGHPITELINTAPLGEIHLSLIEGIMIIVGGMAVGVTIAPDVFRYAKPDNKELMKAAGLYAVVTAIQSPLLAIIVNATGTAELGPVMAYVGGIGILILCLLAWTTNDNNLYSSSLALKLYFPKVKKGILAAVIGVIGSLLGAYGVIQYFISWLSLLGSVFPPIIGIAFADYYILPRLGIRSQIQTKNITSFHWPAMIAWGAGSAIAILMSVGYITMPLAPAIMGMLISFVAYLLLMKLKYKKED